MANSQNKTNTRPQTPLSRVEPVYADALVAFAKERVGKELDPSAEIEDTEYDQRGFPGLAAFRSAAKYHQDCKRAGIAYIPGTGEEEDSPLDDGGGSGLFDEDRGGWIED